MSVNKSESVSEALSPNNGNTLDPHSHRRRRLGARREAAKAETREALLDAAMTIFAEEGLDNPSLDAICAQAGYTRGAFYVHFRDREELVQAVSERFLSTLAAGVALYDDSPEAAFSKLEALVSAVASRSQVPAHQFLHAASRSDSLRERYQTTLANMADSLCDSIQLSQARLTLRGDVSAKQLAWAMLALATGIQTLSEAGTPIDAKQCQQVLAYLLRR